MHLPHQRRSPDCQDDKNKNMEQKAEKLGADAIINVRFMTSSIMGAAAEILAYGTAVKLK